MDSRVLFANVSYNLNGQQFGTFRFVKEKGFAEEKDNFNPVMYKGREVCLGYFEPGYTKGGYEHGNQRQVHIEKIDPCFNKSASASGVITVWCALIPDPINRSAIIGWYRNSTVFRIPNKVEYGEIPGRGDPSYGFLFNVIADKTDCVSLPYDELIKPEWIAPRRKAFGYGFGRSNMWYAKEDAAKEYVESILKQINNYNGANNIR